VVLSDSQADSASSILVTRSTKKHLVRGIDLPFPVPYLSPPSTARAINVPLADRGQAASGAAVTVIAAQLGVGVSVNRPRDHGVRATFLDVAPSTIRAYVARGQMPGADRRIGREPVWRPATIRKWHSQRPRRPQTT